MSLFESGEDYLERILVLKERNGQVRSIDIATDMGFSKPSISIAMKKLKEGGFISIDENGLISLTEEGHAIATRIYERHQVLTAWFISLGVPEDIAMKDACKIEHDLSDESFNAIKQTLKK